MSFHAVAHRYMALEIVYGGELWSLMYQSQALSRTTFVKQIHACTAIVHVMHVLYIQRTKCMRTDISTRMYTCIVYYPA